MYVGQTKSDSVKSHAVMTTIMFASFRYIMLVSRCLHKDLFSQISSVQSSWTRAELWALNYEVNTETNKPSTKIVCIR